MKRFIVVVVAFLCVCPSLFGQTMEAEKVFPIDVKGFDEAEYKREQEFLQSLASTKYSKAGETDYQRQKRLKTFIAKWDGKQLTTFNMVSSFSSVGDNTFMVSYGDKNGVYISTKGLVYAKMGDDQASRVTTNTYLVIYGKLKLVKLSGNEDVRRLILNQKSLLGIELGLIDKPMDIYAFVLTNHQLQLQVKQKNKPLREIKE